MKKSVFLVLILWASLSASAQNLGKDYTTQSKDIGSKKEVRIKDVLCSSEHGVYLLKKDDGKEVIVLMTSKGVMTSEAIMEPTLADGKSERKINEAFIAGPNLFVVSAAYDKKEKRKYVMVDQYNAETLEFIKTAAENIEDYGGQKGAYVYGIGALRAMDELYEEDVAVSNNGKYWAVYTSSYTKDKNAKEGLNLGVYDQNGELFWNMNEELEYGNKEIDLGYIEVGGNGDVYMRCSMYNPSSKAWGQRTMKINRGSGDLEFTALPDAADGMTGIIRGVMDNGNWEIYGYTESDGGNINGYKVIEYDPVNDKVLSENSGTFSEEFIRQFITKGQEEKAAKKGEEVDLGIRSFEARQIIKSADGTKFMVGEQYRYVVRTYTDSKGGTHTTTTYQYGAIIVIKLDAAGNMLWSARVPRSQISSTDRFVGHYLSVCNGEVTILYNDSERNCETPDNDDPMRFTADMSSSRIHVFHISANGEVKGYAMPGDEDGYGKFRMGNATGLDGCGIFVLEEFKQSYKARFIFPKK